jgi:hypothetical protein
MKLKKLFSNIAGVTLVKPLPMFLEAERKRKVRRKNK